MKQTIKRRITKERDNNLEFMKTMKGNKMSEAHDRLDEICENCGCTRGSHLSATYYSGVDKRFYPRNYCPGHEGRMDWNNGPGTVFKPTGNFRGCKR